MLLRGGGLSWPSPSIIWHSIVISILILRFNSPTDGKMSTIFENKYAIVTGGSRGIGASIALLLAKRGAKGVCLLHQIWLHK